MEEQKDEKENNNMLVGIMAGFAAVLFFYMILGSSFNEVMMLGLFFIFLAIGISSFVEVRIEDDSEEES